MKERNDMNAGIQRNVDEALTALYQILNMPLSADMTLAEALIIGNKVLAAKRILNNEDEVSEIVYTVTNKP